MWGLKIMPGLTVPFGSLAEVYKVGLQQSQAPPTVNDRWGESASPAEPIIRRERKTSPSENSQLDTINANVFEGVFLQLLLQQ